ncbi:glycosyltransferase family 2 protein [Mucilaginibacter robiniae]|uniref:Glycosyltransferase family 2 protein n=1 Tax=Mucilaginibacter robiniae TaxID=2728022 RepID=A0A7L5E994_9SPHI|nr:glycosyltransferase family 2 protein [Mucilaginibacter robiniae]QJD96956.1 glycosyltransferase family 2 protein [Mucilaginibacter robiniae]
MEIVKPELLQALILTKNEEPNIKRVLDKLTWLQKVVVVDSGSTDNTLTIMQAYSNVEVVYRKFDTFAQQCNYGLTLLNSEWVLSLDADYVLTDGFIEETRSFIATKNDKVAYLTKFEFLIFGKQLINNNTTPRPVLFKRNAGSYFDDGHAHRLKIDGAEGFYHSKILHDDQKSLSRWISNQDGYSIRECNKLLDSSNPDANSILNRIRCTKVLAPFFVFFYCLFVRGLFLSGWAGWYYTLQRTMVEILFALRLIEEENLKGK